MSLFFVFFVGRTFNSETFKRDWILTTKGITHFRKGLDISGGTKLVYKIDYSKYKELYSANEFLQVKKNIEQVILKNIDSRISGLGVSDYVAKIQTIGEETQVVVEIGGVADLDQAKEIIGKTVELEFRIENDEEATPETIAQRKALAEKIRTEVIATPEKMIELYANQEAENIIARTITGTLDQLPDLYKTHSQLLNTIPLNQISNLLEGTYLTQTYQTVSGENLTQGVDGFLTFRVSARNEVPVVAWTGEVNTGTQMLYTIDEIFVQDRLSWKIAQGKDGSPLNGAYFTLARPETTQFWQPSVGIEFNQKWSELFCEITSNNVGKSMGIFIWGKPATIANINEKICDGRAQISGGFDKERATETAKELNSGNMPAPLILLQEEKVSPSLGDSAFQGALVATGVGVLAIIIYMFFIYGRRKATVTTATMIFYFIVLLAILKLIDYALSLSGIAAIILSIGMAVDANVLIFERMNEEVKNNKSYLSAIETASKRSWAAIRDGQISTLLIWVLLFAYGINIFKGFGSMIILTAILTLVLNVPFIKETLLVIYNRNLNLKIRFLFLLWRYLLFSHSITSCNKSKISSANNKVNLDSLEG